mmetsp:Transcript_23872/g.43657  ORF Transcript_23872/g.43657 Transcript_23872/m.43657 type:complete len:476 (+) Transcript_23872:149-1576(+)
MADVESREERKKAVKEHRENMLSTTKGEQQLATVKRRFRSKKKHFLCTLPLRNRLPDPVPGPKLLALPMELQNFVAFKPTSLDTEFKWKHHCERTLGVHIDLVDLDNGDSSSSAFGGQRLHPDDERLLKWDQQNAGVQAARKDRAFFRKTTFMANDLSRSSALRGGATARQEAADEVEEDAAIVLLRDAVASFGTAVLRETTSATLGVSDAGGSDGVAGKRKLMHPTKPHLTCEWSLPVLPDSTTWANHYRYVGFDDDPLVRDGSKGEGVNKRAKAAAVLEGLIVNAKNEYSSRAQDNILTGSLVVPSSVSSGGGSSAEGYEGGVDYEWRRQYQMNMEKVSAEGLRGNLVLFVDPSKGVVTYKELAPQKLDLRGGVSGMKQRVEESDTYLVKRRDFTPEEHHERLLLSKAFVAGQSDAGEGGEESGDDDGDEEEFGSGTGESSAVPLPPDDQIQTEEDAEYTKVQIDDEDGLSDA